MTKTDNIVWIDGWPHIKDVDALLAEKVLGWKKVGVLIDPVQPSWMDGEIVRVVPPDFKTDIAAAMLLFCKVNENADERGSELLIDSKSVSWFPKNLSWPHDNTLESIASAIRLAALKAVELKD